MIVKKIDNMAAEMFNCKENKLMVVFLFYVAISKTLLDNFKKNPQIVGYSQGMQCINLRIKNLERSKKKSLGPVEPIVFKKLKQLCLFERQ